MSLSRSPTTTIRVCGLSRPSCRPCANPRNQRWLSFSRSVCGSASGRAQVSSPLTPNGRPPSVNPTVACTNSPRALLERSFSGPSPAVLPPRPV